MPEHWDLAPLNVWEFNEDGSVFDRAMVVERVDDWLRRIANVYAQVEVWATQTGLTVECARTIIMSEELMQKFAIPDRELAMLDLSRDGKPVMAIVPVGLWVIGSNGRIDIITPDGTTLLLDRARPLEAPNWVYLVRGEGPEFRPWDEDAFRRLAQAKPVA